VVSDSNSLVDLVVPKAMTLDSKEQPLLLQEDTTSAVPNSGKPTLTRLQASIYFALGSLLGCLLGLLLLTQRHHATGHLRTAIDRVENIVVMDHACGHGPLAASSSDALACRRATLMKQVTAAVLAESNTQEKTSLTGAADQIWPFALTPAHGKGAPKARLVQSVRFLVLHMPAEDVGSVGVGFLVRNVLLAWAARLHAPWGPTVPWQVFLNDVLPYACLREPRDEWRPLFASVMPGYLGDSDNAGQSTWSSSTPPPATATTADTALTLNDKAWSIVNPPIKFLAATTNGLNSYSVFQTMRRHNSSCTGLSIFLVSALRSVGVPARVAGVPHWNRGVRECPLGDESENCGNHNWVEVWSNVDRRWHFVDQDAKPNALDVAWFFPAGVQGLLPLHGNHSVYASSWAPTSELVDVKEYSSDHAQVSQYFPLGWDWQYKGVRAWDNTAMYKRRAD
jgi:hypothetical protein